MVEEERGRTCTFRGAEPGPTEHTPSASLTPAGSYFTCNFVVAVNYVNNKY